MKNRSLPGAAGSAPIPKGEKKRIAASGVVLMVLCVFLLVALIVVLLTSAPKPGPEDMALRYAQAQLVLDWAEMDELDPVDLAGDCRSGYVAQYGTLANALSRLSDSDGRDYRDISDLWNQRKSQRSEELTALYGEDYEITVEVVQNSNYLGSDLPRIVAELSQTPSLGSQTPLGELCDVERADQVRKIILACQVGDESSRASILVVRIDGQWYPLSATWEMEE